MQLSSLFAATRTGLAESAAPRPRSDELVVTAWNSRTLTDGTRLDLGTTDKEQGFVVRDDGIFPVSIRQSGEMVCEDGSRRIANRISVADIRPNSGGHTHPQGRYGDIVGLPGPEDGVMAARTGKPAYVISSRGAFRIEASSTGFEVKLLAGKAVTSTERGEISRIVGSWNNNAGGSGVRCTFVSE